MTSHSQKTLWSDQDGVIAEYEYHAYTIPLEDGNTLFMKPNAHYFRTLTPDNRIIKAYELLQQENNLPVHVLTNLTDYYPIWKEHRQDKIEWTKEYMPFINIETQYDTIHIPKYLKAQKILQRPLTETDILISDYNPDLTPWENAGGTAVKYLNGINSEDSFSGLKIYPHMSSNDIREFILELP